MLAELLALRTISPSPASGPSDSGQFTVPPSALASRAQMTLAAIAGDAGIIGVVMRDVGGTVSSAGAVDPRLEERASHLARLAVLVGEELGLESLRELHLGGSHNRVTWLRDEDGGSSCVLARVETDMVAISKKVRR